MDARAWSRLLTAVEPGELRARTAALKLAELEPDEAVGLLLDLLHAAARRKPLEAAALEGALQALREHLPAEALSALRRAAEAAGSVELETLLSQAPAAAEFDKDREEWVDREMQSHTLGARRQMARGRDPDLLARLARDPDPQVVRRMLENPRCTEREALLAASRRPVRPAVLAELLHSRRWGTNRRVRKAVAQNPYAPPALAAGALSLLTAPELREVSRDGSLTPEVRVEARRLLAARRGQS